MSYDMTAQRRELFPCDVDGSLECFEAVWTVIMPIRDTIGGALEASIMTAGLSQERSQV
jgi:hypothetical protein